MKGAYKIGGVAVCNPQMFLPTPKKKSKFIPDDAWEDLLKSRPNFHEVTEYVRAYVKRNELLDRPFRMPPILLDGPPGVGKTSYARKLAELLGLPAQLESAQNLMRGFDLSGTSSVYCDSGPGMIFNVISQSRCFNPIFIFDEIDKVGTKNDHDASVVDTLLSLLERETAEQFVEHFFRTPMDASYINWIMTSNDATLCSPMIRSRLKVFSIKKPDLDEIDDVIQSIYSKVVETEEVGPYFREELDDLCVHALRGIDLREVKRKIEHGINQCLMEVEDLSHDMSIARHHLEEKTKKRNIFR